MDQTARPDPLARARELGEAIAAAADEIERTRRIPEPLLTRLHEARLFRMLLPRSVDGDQVAPDDYLLALEEVARHDASVAWNMFIANSAALLAPYLEPEAARAIFENPRALIASGPPNGVTAAAEPGGYRVSGRWDFASGCHQASWMGVHCDIIEQDGSLRRREDGRPKTLTLLFPIEKATLLDNWNTIGLRGTGSDSYRVDDLFVAEAFTCTRGDPGSRRERGPLYAFTMQGLYAVGSAGCALGIARAMLDAFAALAAGKTPRDLKRMADSATVQAGVARNEAKLGGARAYLLATLADIYARADDAAPIDVANRARVRLAAVHAIHSATEVADYVYKAAGVDSIYPDGPFERRFRDIHTLTQQIQARDSHYESVGRILLGEPAPNFL